MPAALPRRFQPTSDLRATQGKRVEEFGRRLLVGDPLADAAAAELAALGPGGARRRIADALARGIDGTLSGQPALAALFADVESVPLWVDWPTLDRGGALFRRHAALVQLVLTCGALPWSYASPAGNKPLTHTGRLVQRAPRRLAETGQFVVALTRPGGLRRGAEGFATCVRVRLMHAEVRRRLLLSPTWDADWGVPINQADQAATHLSFTLVVLDGLRALGVSPTDAESRDLFALWRYAARLLGLDADVVPVDETDARRLLALVRDTQAPPDDDSRALVRAVLQSSPLVVGAEPGTRAGNAAQALATGLCRHLLGPALADALDVPDTRWTVPARWLGRITSPVDRLRRRSTWADRIAVRAGDALWDAALRRGLEGEPARYEHAPERR